MPSGIWSYQAKLYPDVAFPQTKMTVDVLTKSDDSNGIFVNVFTSADNTEAHPTSAPILIFAKITKNNMPILNASATAWLYMPGTPEENPVYELLLRDDGLGFPDMTSGDGIYSAYAPGYATKPGYYSLRIRVTDNQGNAVQPKHPSPAAQISKSITVFMCAGHGDRGIVVYCQVFIEPCIVFSHVACRAWFL